ncbi:hypothetical protein [Trichocoleus sp. FACHB-40]|uniref:hypothetical protein n=1 Tax=Trichocoleus sp. FACHB-40 TaxID=2692870 RepID=UPI001F54DBB3|nr:hypothetical protein [Trichocoleus sp. FACHB-40]
MSSKSQRPPNWLLQQFQLKPGKPDIAASLQTLVLVLVPIGVGVLMGHPAASAIAPSKKDSVCVAGLRRSQNNCITDGYMA